MKRTFFSSALVLAILFMAGCTKDPPVAGFTTDKESYKMGETITFTNQSTNAKEYAWDFGDTKKSTDENPTHSYTSAGDFKVSLLVTGSGGTDSITKTFTISPDLTGIWRKTLNFGFAFGINGTMNVTQHPDNTLTGSYVYEDGMGTFTLKPTSKITGNSVLIEWNEATYKFQGTVNAAGTNMSGQITMDSQNAGTWSAKKL